MECKRVLKPGGIARIVVPDFDKLIDSYNQNHDVDRFIHDSCLVGKKPKTIIKYIPRSTYEEQLSGEENLQSYYKGMFEDTTSR